MGLRAEEREGEVWVWHQGVEGELIPADAVILATEVRGLERLAEASDLRRHAPRLAESAASGGEADPYAVVRFWFDQPVLAERTAFYTVAGFDWTDSIAVYSAFQEPYIEWARRTGGSVVEVHAYAIPLDSRASLSTYRDGMLAELRTAFPELANAQVLHSESMTQSNFTRFGPGDFAKRPTVRTEIGNLMIAGDHVQLPFPAFLMEAAVASGRLAANALCALDGVEEVAIPTVSWTGKMTGLG
jgi:isorenieratene synthase